MAVPRSGRPTVGLPCASSDLAPLGAEVGPRGRCCGAPRRWSSIVELVRPRRASAASWFAVGAPMRSAPGRRHRARRTGRSTDSRRAHVFRTCGNLRRTTVRSHAAAVSARRIACGHASASLPLLALGRHAGRLRARRRRGPRRDHRRPALPRRPQRRAAADDAAGLPRPQRRARPGHARDAREAAPQAPRTQLERYDLGGVYDDIAQELRDVVDTEREALDELPQRGARVRRPAPPGDHRPGRRASGRPAARHAAARPRRQVQRAAAVRVHVERGARAVRAS